MWTVAVLLLVAVVGTAAVVRVMMPARSDPETEGSGAVSALEALGRAARAAAMRVTTLDHRSDTRVLVELVDGTTLDMFLFWPRTADPLRLLDVRWRDEVGWMLEFEVAPHERQAFYAWRCRIAPPATRAA